MGARWVCLQGRPDEPHKPQKWGCFPTYDSLVVMPTNNTGAKVRDLYDRFPGRIGHLMSPLGWRKPWGTYALDNGAFGAWKNQTRWRRTDFLDLCEKAVAHGEAPRWVVVPDVVANREETLRSWTSWAPTLREWYGWPLAFAVQDGMAEGDIPDDADVLFVGGTTEWKWATLPRWCAMGRRVHVGRVNSPRALRRCAELGVESVDGTGWVRGNQDQWDGLVQFLADPAMDHRGGLTLFLPPNTEEA
jgi:hypothetical protein